MSTQRFTATVDDLSGELDVWLDRNLSRANQWVPLSVEAESPIKPAVEPQLIAIELTDI
jgi:hypothetical protein